MQYDYIVIGAGSAGCALAARLSEKEDLTVLLLEAGGPDTNPDIHVPQATGALWESSDAWQFATVPQANCNNREIAYPQGKVYGGSSSINAMVYQRGNPADYDGWAQLGNEGWSWEDVLPYFIKSEHQERGASEFHGQGGSLNVADVTYPNPISRTLVQAAIEAGYPHNEDFNDGNQEGFGLFQVTQKNGKRHSAAVGYLRPALERDNLTAIPFAAAQRLLFDGTRCTGVVYEKDGTVHEVSATKEVILSCGSFKSPHLLMLSGIGDKGHLVEHGIELVKELTGVGQNLQEHLMIGLAYICQNKHWLSADEEPELFAQFERLSEYASTSNGLEAGGFVTIDAGARAPEIQFHFQARARRNMDEGADLVIFPGVVGTKSIGQLSLQSSDPHDPILIDPNFLSDEYDLRLMVEAVKIAREIAKSPAFDVFGIQEIFPGSGISTDAQIVEFIRENLRHIYHPVGTCKMGNDPMAVVNDRLQVHGIQGLRVADASIMPRIINANTNAAAIMIGEKCADMILGAI